MVIQARRFSITGVLVVAGALLCVVPQARAADSLKQCFTSGELENWLAPDAKTIYIRAANGHFYRIDLARECAPLKWGDARLITHTFGGNLICSPTDIVLAAAESQPGGFAEPCFIKGMTELSKAEADALPRGSRP